MTNSKSSNINHLSGSQEVFQFDPPENQNRHMYDESGTLFLNGVQLQPAKAFGFSQNKDHICCLQSNRIAYVCGNTISIYNTITGQQEIIPLTQTNINILRTFKNTYNQQCFIFTHNEPDSTPCITILNSWKNKRDKYVLDNLQKSEQILDINYLMETNEMICLSRDSSNSSKLTRIYQTRDAKSFTELIDLEVKGLFQDRRISSNFYYFSSKQIHRCKFQNGFIHTKIKIQLDPMQEILCCSLVNIGGDQIIVYVTSLGNLYIIIEDDMGVTIQKQILAKEELNPQGHKITKQRKPSSVCCNDIFILVGYQSIPQITCFKISNLSFLKRDRQDIHLNTSNLSQIKSIHVSEQQSIICFLAEMKGQFKYQYKQLTPQERQFQLGGKGRLVPILFNYLLYQTSSVHTKSPFVTLFDSMVSSKPILEVQICLMKKIIVVLSGDKRIRAYYLHNPSKLPLSRLFLWQFQFPEYCYSIAIHPNNQNVAVAFKDEMKLYSLGNYGLKYLNISHPQKSQIVRYSNKGNYLAAVHLQSSIMLFNSYSFQITSVLTFNNICIRSFQFLGNDEYLLLNGKNNNVMISTIVGKRVIQNSNRTMKLTASAYDPEYDILILSYSESLTKIYTEQGRNQLGIIFTFPFYFSCFLISPEYNSIFAGTSTGIIRIYEWPITDSTVFEKMFIQYTLHSSSITSLKLSTDYKYLISSSQDGSVLVTKLKHYSNGFMTPQGQLNYIFKNVTKDNFIAQFAPLVVNSINEDRQKDQNLIRFQAEKLMNKQSNDGQMMKDKMGYEKEYRAVQSLKKNQKDRVSGQYNREITQYEFLKKQIVEKREQLQKKRKQLEVQKQQFFQKLRGIYQKSRNLKSEKVKLINQYASYLQIFKARNLQTQMLQEQNLKQSLNSKTVKQTKTAIDIEEFQREQQQQAQQRLQEENIQKCQLLNRYSQKIEQAHRKHDNLEKQNQFLQNYMQMYKETLLKRVVFKDSMDSNLNDLQMEKEKRKECIQIAMQEILKRDQVIFQQQQKAKRYLKFNIYQMNEEGCLKYVLTELDKQNNRLDEKWQQLEKQKNKVDKGLISETNNSKELDQLILEARRNIRRYKQNISKLSQKLYVRKYKLSKASRTVETILHSGQDIKSQLLGMMNYISITVDQNVEQKDQINYAEKQLERDTYLNMIDGNMKLHEANKLLKNNYEHKIRGQATMLISEYNRLRFQQIGLKETYQILEKQFKEVIQEKERTALVKKESGLFPTALPQQKQNRTSTTSSVKRNFRKNKICKGTTKIKGLLSSAVEINNQN